MAYLAWLYNLRNGYFPMTREEWRSKREVDLRFDPADAPGSTPRLDDLPDSRRRLNVDDLTTQELREAASDLARDAYDGDWPPAKPQEPFRAPRAPDERSAKKLEAFNPASAGHLLERTSPKGQDFVGKCRYCGAEGGPGLGLEYCPNAPGNEQSLIDAVEGPVDPYATGVADGDAVQGRAMRPGESFADYEASQSTPAVPPEANILDDEHVARHIEKNKPAKRMTKEERAAQRLK